MSDLTFELSFNLPICIAHIISIFFPMLWHMTLLCLLVSFIVLACYIITTLFTLFGASSNRTWWWALLTFFVGMHYALGGHLGAYRLHLTCCRSCLQCLSKMIYQYQIQTWLPSWDTWSVWFCNTAVVVTAPV